MAKSSYFLNTSWMITIGAILFVTAFIILIIYFLDGNTATSNFNKIIERNNTINCSAKEIIYPFLDYNNFISNILTINATFDYNNNLQSISLVHRLQYDNAEQANMSYAINHASMNRNFTEELGADALNANYTINDNVLQISLYANDTDLSDKSLQFFLIGNKNFKDKENLINLYKSMDFDCMSKY